MKGIECAFQGRLAKDGELRTTNAGRQWLALEVMVGEGADAEWISVGSWSHTVHDLAPMLREGAEVYIEGKLKIRKFEGANGAERLWLSVQASVVQPMGLIGEKKPKRPRAAAQQTKQTSAAVNAPLPFDDDISYIGT